MRESYSVGFLGENKEVGIFRIGILEGITAANQRGDLICFRTFL